MATLCHFCWRIFLVCTENHFPKGLFRILLQCSTHIELYSGRNIVQIINTKRNAPFQDTDLNVKEKKKESYEAEEERKERENARENRKQERKKESNWFCRIIGHT